MLDDTQNYTNNFYICEFVKIVLFQAGYITLNIEEIATKIEELTSLRYTEEDIIIAIHQWNNGYIDCQDGQYSLTTLGSEQMTHRTQTRDIKQYIRVFLEEHCTDAGITIAEFSELVERFIYLRFNENLKQISEIFNHSLTIDEMTEDFDENQRKVINEFLNWDHSEKNKCVFHLIAKAYDYCMINTRCSTKEIDFTKHTFYLDTNIIFRMLGINGEMRQQSISNLINKCIDVGAHLCVNTFVKMECEKAISDQIAVLEDTTSGFQSLIPPSAMGFAEEQSVRTDFYKKYYEWVKAGNAHRNYEGFRRKVMSDLHRILQRFDSDEERPSYKVMKKADFGKFFDSLYEVKGDKHTTETDINSFMLVQDKRQENPESEYYLISADKKFVTWLKDNFASTKSYADYPSTWLSIILKYTGRELESDYKSFCQFIHLSITPKVEDLEKKIAIKSSVLSSDFSDSIKAMMIEDISKNYTSYSQYDIEDIIHRAYAKTEKQIAATASSTKEKEYNEKLAEAERSHAEELERARKRLEVSEAEKELREKLAYEKGKEEQKAIEREARVIEKTNKMIKRNKIVLIALSGLFIAVILFCIVVWVLFLFKGYITQDNEIFKAIAENPIWVTVLCFLVDIVVGVLKWILKKFNVLSTDEDIVRQTAEKKVK